MSEIYNDENIKKVLEEKNVPEAFSPESMKVMLDKFGYQQRRSRNIKFNIMKIGSFAAALALVVGITAAIYPLKDKCEIVDSGISYHDCDTSSQAIIAEPLGFNNMKYAESYDEIYDYFNLKNSRYYDSSSQYVKGFGKDEMVYEAAEDGLVDEEGIAGEESDMMYDFESAPPSSNSSLNNADYTNTYNQESGVLESDIVKTDGKTIYYTSSYGIKAAQVENGKFKEVKTFAEDLGYINSMYLYDDKLVVISDSKFEALDFYDALNSSVDSTVVTIYSKEDYSMLGQYEQKGYYTDVRLREDGFMYLVTDQSDYGCYEYDGEIKPQDTSKYIPSYTVNDEINSLPCSNILISELEPDSTSPWISYINLSAFDLNSSVPYNPTDVKAVAGNAGTIYCSMKNLYVTFGWDNTEITRFEISEGTIIPKAGTSVKGVVKDQFSMSEYNGYFRIATTFDNFDFFGLTAIETNNCLYVLDMNLDEVGQISNFGLDETIKSVNFNGDMAYIVTFRQTDPLYAIDLSDPANPKKTDELKITGYSSYMQSWADGMLLGFGENGDEDGNLNGLKLSMFDNSDPDNLRVIDTAEIGNNFNHKNAYLYSYAISDRKALLISPKHNIIGVPVNIDLIYTDSYNGKYAYIFYSFENGKFKELGEISTDVTGGTYLDGLHRAVIIGDYVYAFSDKVFISADIKNFNQVDSYEFNDEYIENSYYGIID